MAPTTVSKPGAVLPVENANFLDAHVFPGIPGVYQPGVPVALDKLGVDEASFRSAIDELALPLEVGTFEFAPEPEPVDEHLEALKKLKVPALLAHAAAAGVDEATLAELKRVGVSKQTIIDAIAAAGVAAREEA